MCKRKKKMQVVNPQNSVHKSNKKRSNVTKKTSCSRGWLHLAVQCLFGGITIVSFVLILYTTMLNTQNEPDRESRCELQSCRITCSYAPFFNQYEDDIKRVASEGSSTCSHMSITLNEPYFLNATIPQQWLFDIRPNIEELEIIGGNLKYFAPQSFVSPFGGNLKRLILENVLIIKWTPSILSGLSSLNELCIKHCSILQIETFALDAVDETLLSLRITDSGVFDPINLTGGLQNDMRVHTVTFSSNNFNNILTKDSFRNLKHCKVMYLNSCRITSLGDGTFDHFESIEVLHLNDNFLVVLPFGLFDKIMTITYPRPRINLQDNLWYCDCRLDLQLWVSEGILLVDPRCYYPTEVRQMLFSDFINVCNNETSRLFVSHQTSEYTDIVQINGSCGNRIFRSLRSPIEMLSCNINNKWSVIEFITSKLVRLIKTAADNDLLISKFAVRADYISMLEIATAGPIKASNFGLVWFQSECPQEIYCINTIPSYLKVYNFDETAQFTFCPIILDTGEIYDEKCIFYNAPLQMSTLGNLLTFMSYGITVLFCLTVGACIVYGIILKFPYLLKGSDRIVFVKHKHVEALVLPPKVPLRCVNSIEAFEIKQRNEIFTLSDNKMLGDALIRCKTRSSIKSIAPSYISALQPTDEQLTEWRLRHHFGSDVTSNLDGPYSLFSDHESIYCSISDTNGTT